MTSEQAMVEAFHSKFEILIQMKEHNDQRTGHGGSISQQV